MNHSFIVFKNIAVIQTTFQKHLGVIIDSRLTFVDHLDSVQSKLNKAIGLLRKLQNTSPRPVLMSIYKTFTRPHLNYGDILYHQAYNTSFHQKLERIK